ncbi:34ca389c-8ae4-4091-bf6b-85b2f43f50b9 [Thermothielavioides terrestris]|uniref:holo-[acyl-carrier-protein] synthase n=1 Tax=Thermothielavioides terrestris TaxID=2587410 RepID=A0A3S4AJS3_9PEZI|nr:34ca389c-8ae4-4091-bf6b-85b2f43f50b9 [Thermothielavioides terrestris]
MSSPEQPVLAQWVFDTRPWFPDARVTKDLETHAARALSLLNPEARLGVFRYLRLADAKMALASALLKQYAVAKLARDPPVAWSQFMATPSGFTRNARTKPVYIDPATGRQPVSFNVSHQAGIVAIIAVDQEIQVGVDVVCTSERRARDHAILAAGDDGWADFLDIHKDVFAPGEVRYLHSRVLAAVPGLVAQAARAHAHLDAAAGAETGAGAGDGSGAGPPPRGVLAGGPPTPEQTMDAKLRAFYALWALREAYVKLTGDALVAPWLHELEFVDFRPPWPAAAPLGAAAAAAAAAREGQGQGQESGGPGGEEEEEPEVEPEVVRSTEIRFRGRKVEDVNMCLRSMGPDYMVATAVRTPGRPEEALGWRIGPYEVLSLEEVLSFAESSR